MTRRSLSEPGVGLMNCFRRELSSAFLLAASLLVTVVLMAASQSDSSQGRPASGPE